MMNGRTRALRKVRHGIRNPGRALVHARRILRNRNIAARTTSHTEFYREVVDSVALVDPDRAIGAESRQQWAAVGRFQFEYLIKHGLQRGHNMLEIGCGNLRAGIHLIDYLHIGRYFGIDISPIILVAAQRSVAEFSLQPKLPHLTLVDNLRFKFLPDQHFDVIHAHSVFSHTRIDVIEECLEYVGRILKPEGFFDFTYFDGPESVFADEDFSYPEELLVQCARKFGLKTERMVDWEYPQAKLRVRLCK